MRTSVRVLLLVTPVLVLGGCQACVADSSQPDEPQASPRDPVGSGPVRIRPRLMSPVGQLVLRDAGDADQ